MRVLIIDESAKERISRVVNHAEANHYCPDRGDSVPGDDPNFVIHLGTYRVVFTITHADDLIYRHISVSVRSERYPNPSAVWMIAHSFGFTGWNEDKPADPGSEWVFDINERDNCVTVVQPIGSDPGRGMFQ